MRQGFRGRTRGQQARLQPGSPEQRGSAHPSTRRQADRVLSALAPAARRVTARDTKKRVRTEPATDESDQVMPEVTHVFQESYGPFDAPWAASEEGTRRGVTCPSARADGRMTSLRPQSAAADQPPGGGRLGPKRRTPGGRPGVHLELGAATDGRITRTVGGPISPGQP